MNAAEQTPGQKLASTRARIVLALTSQTQETPSDTKHDTNIFADLLGIYLAQHPLHAAGNAVTHAAQKMLTPWVRKHPLWAVAGAAALGAALVWSRPWRWLRPPALLAGLLPQIVAKLMALRETN